MAPDPHHQSGVKDGAPLLRIQPEPVGQPAGDRCRAEHVLGGLPQTEVDGNGQPSQDLDTPRENPGAGSARTPHGLILLLLATLGPPLEIRDRRVPACATYWPMPASAGVRARLLRRTTVRAGFRRPY